MRRKKVSEASIEKAVCKYARTLGYFHAKFTSVHNRSVPDRLFINPQGMTIYIEFKAPGKKPTEMQLSKHAQMHGGRTPIYVVDSVERGKQVLEGYLKHRHQPSER